MIVAQSGTSWPDAAIAIAGIALVALIAFVVVSQVFATWRARMAVAREEAYRALAAETAESNARLSEAVERTASEVADVRSRTAEIERILREVD